MRGSNDPERVAGFVCFHCAAVIGRTQVYLRIAISASITRHCAGLPGSNDIYILWNLWSVDVIALSDAARLKQFGLGLVKSRRAV